MSLQVKNEILFTQPDIWPSNVFIQNDKTVWKEPSVTNLTFNSYGGLFFSFFSVSVADRVIIFRLNKKYWQGISYDLNILSVSGKITLFWAA